mmetsp:Transcript_31083/g.99407  ORF Transcript_31083/g.99407 Transcript_31083/m.99407 type:complete len:364 (+) Transcript_31083:35-1126(+)
MDVPRPAYVPFALSDEQYAAILRAPEAHRRYGVLSQAPPGASSFGTLYLLRQQSPEEGVRPAARAAASIRLLSDGVTMLARRTPSKHTQAGAGSAASIAARPVRAFSLFVRAQSESLKRTQPDQGAAAVRKAVEASWQSLSDAQRAVYVQAAREHNAGIRKRQALAPPSQLCTRHELWLEGGAASPFSSLLPSSSSAPPPRPQLVLVHVLGEPAMQTLTAPPVAVQTADAPAPADVRTMQLRLAWQPGPSMMAAAARAPQMMGAQPVQTAIVPPGGLVGSAAAALPASGVSLPGGSLAPPPPLNVVEPAPHPSAPPTPSRRPPLPPRQSPRPGSSLAPPAQAGNTTMEQGGSEKFDVAYAIAD